MEMTKLIKHMFNCCVSSYLFIGIINCKSRSKERDLFDDILEYLEEEFFISLPSKKVLKFDKLWQINLSFLQAIRKNRSQEELCHLKVNLDLGYLLQDLDRSFISSDIDSFSED